MVAYNYCLRADAPPRFSSRRKTSRLAKSESSKRKNLAPSASVFIALSKQLRVVIQSQYLVRLDNRDPVRQQPHRPGEESFLAHVCLAYFFPRFMPAKPGPS
jgi:hypothetical protein